MDRYHTVTKYTERLAAQFLELIARGHLATTAAEAIGVTPNCIQLWRRSRPGFADAYASARQEASTLPALPDGRCLKRWESRLADAAPFPVSETIKASPPLSASRGV